MVEAALPVVRFTKGHYSLAYVRDHWYIACRSKELRDKPLPRTILGTPMVLFRAEGGRPAALLDRCAHRNVPLSLGFAKDERLVCGYHGWEYDGEGICQKVPALCGPQIGKARRVPNYPVREQQGYVWVYANADVEPKNEPYTFPMMDDPRYSSVHYDSGFEATLHATLENILDVPHTAFLHRGLFRGVKQNEITAIIRKKWDRVEAQFVGEPRPEGWLGRILAPGGGEVMHFDRFILPSIAQVEYALGEKNHLLINSVLTPVNDFETKMYAVITFRVALPAVILKLILTPLGKRVVAQDAVMLKRQTEAVQRFGGEQYASTDVDLLGPHILRLLKQAERGDKIDDTALPEERIRLLA